MTHQTTYDGRSYCRLTFTPHGASRPRSVWAIKLRDGVFLRASAEGGPWEDPKSPEGVERREMILVHKDDDFEALPAGVSLHYGRLEVL